jgi:hypothetical protein
VSTLKTLTGKTTQELREFLEQLIKDLHKTSSSNIEQPTPTSVQHVEDEQHVDVVTAVALPTAPQFEEKKHEEIEPTTNEPEDSITPSRSHFTEYPLQFDTREQNIPLEQIFQDGTFLSDGFPEATTRPSSRFLRHLFSRSSFLFV